MEPIIGSAGVIVPHKNYLKIIRKVCDENNILLVADEVICAFGRTGDWTGMYWGEHEQNPTKWKVIAPAYK